MSAAAQSHSRARSSIVHPWLIGCILVISDQLTKLAVVRSFAPGESVPIIPGALHLTYVLNTGAAFGWLKGQQILFSVLSVLIIGWIAWETHQRPPAPATMRWAYSLIVGGAAGNLIDRLRIGSVIDFIDLRVWPVFNLADSAITIGVVLLLWKTLKCR